MNCREMRASSCGVSGLVKKANLSQSPYDTLLKQQRSNPEPAQEQNVENKAPIVRQSHNAVLLNSLAQSSPESIKVYCLIFFPLGDTSEKKTKSQNK